MFLKVRYMITFIFYFCLPSWLPGSQFPNQRLKSGHSSVLVLTTGQPGNSLINILAEDVPLWSSWDSELSLQRPRFNAWLGNWDTAKPPGMAKFFKNKICIPRQYFVFYFKMMDFLNKNYWVKEHEHFLWGLHEVSVVAGSFAVAPWPSSCGGVPALQGSVVAVHWLNCACMWDTTSWARDWTGVAWITSWNLNHWITRKVLHEYF